MAGIQPLPGEERGFPLFPSPLPPLTSSLTVAGKGKAFSFLRQKLLLDPVPVLACLSHIESIYE